MFLNRKVVGKKIKKTFYAEYMFIAFTVFNVIRQKGGLD